MAFIQKIYDTGLSQFVFYTKAVIDLVPSSGETTPNHSGVGNLVASTHVIVAETGATLEVQDEGSIITVNTRSFNFVGSGVTSVASNDDVTVTITGSGSLGAHAATHLSGDTDEINGDQLDIDYNPTTYTPSLAGGLSTQTYHLTSHLKGINDYLASIPSPGEVNTSSNVGTGLGVFKSKVGLDFQFKSLLTGYGIALSSGTDEVTISNKTAITTLTDGALVAINADNGPKYELTVAGNRTLQNPTNTAAGKTIEIIIKQDATGGRLLSFDSDWIPVGKNFQIAQKANAVSVIKATAQGLTPKWYYLIEHTEFTEITATQITSDQTAWNPEGKSFADFIRISSDLSSRALQGIIAPAQNVEKSFFKAVLVGTNNLVIYHEDSGASATNRIVTPTQANLTLSPNDTITFQYDYTSQRWRLF